MSLQRRAGFRRFAFLDTNPDTVPGAVTTDETTIEKCQRPVIGTTTGILDAGFEVYAECVSNTRVRDMSAIDLGLPSAASK